MLTDRETRRARRAAVLARIRELASDAEYGRKRMLEVRSGHVFTEETRLRRARAEIRHLNNLFTDEAISCSADREREQLDAQNEDRRDDRPRLGGT